MTVQEAIQALEGAGDPDFPVIVLRKDDGRLLAAAGLGVALDESTEDVSIVMGEFHDEDVDLDDVVLEDAVSIVDVREALASVSERCADWPMFSAEVENPTAGGSLVGYSVDGDLEVFAFLQGPKSEWVD